MIKELLTKIKARPPGALKNKLRQGLNNTVAMVVVIRRNEGVKRLCLQLHLRLALPCLALPCPAAVINIPVAVGCGSCTAQYPLLLKLQVLVNNSYPYKSDKPFPTTLLSLIV